MKPDPLRFPFLQVCYFLGLLDASGWLAFFIDIKIENYYLCAIFLKIAVFLYVRPRFLTSFISFLPYLLLLFFLCFISLFGTLVVWSDEIAKLAAFFVSLVLTVLFFDYKDFSYYFNAVRHSILICSFLWLFMYFNGNISVVNNRPMFFSGSHPNLGSEIFAIGALSWSLLRNWKSVFALLPFSASCFFLQGRSSLLSLFCLLVVVTFFILKKNFILFAPVVLCGFFLLYFSGFFSDAFYLDDPNRGIGSGFSGRVAERDFALRLFYKNYFRGIGFGFFDGERAMYPHNILVHGFCELGIGFFVFILFFILLLKKIAKINFYYFLISLCLFPLLYFNARFINLNSYPFIYYVFLLNFATTKR